MALGSGQDAEKDRRRLTALVTPDKFPSFGIELRHHAGFDSRAVILGTGVPGCLIGRFQRHRHVPAICQEERHVRQRVADADRLDVGCAPPRFRRRPECDPYPLVA